MTAADRRVVDALCAAFEANRSLTSELTSEINRQSERTAAEFSQLYKVVELITDRISKLTTLVCGEPAPQRPTLTVLAGDSKPARRRRRAPKLRLVNGGAA